MSVLLFPKLYHFDDVQSMNSSITSIVLPDWTCNDVDYTIFDFSRFTQVESIEIGNDCFGSVQTFKIDKLNRLKTIKIGINSFTQVKKILWDDDWEEAHKGTNKTKSFYILNCESLESIQIGEYSFNDFGGEFELKNLPQLQSIQIGDTESDSFNLHSSFLEIHSTLQLYILLCIRLFCSDGSLNREIFFPEFSCS